MQNNKKSGPELILKLAIFIILPLVIAFAIIMILPRYYYDISDWARLRNYNPPERIAELAEESSFTEEGRDIFYVHDPRLNEKAEFNENCPFAERTFVLGCYTGNDIYILEVEDPKLKSVETVTAAHEMLHAAYSRLSVSERDRIDQLLEDAFAKQKDERLIELINDYKKQDASSVPTELHSILGTEVADLGPELEEHYDQYFVNRITVVDAYKSYESVFSKLEKDIENLQAEIDGLAKEIERLESDIKTTREDINDINARLESLRESGDVSGYNGLVPEQNQLVNSYNADVKQYNSSIKLHNDKVKEINQIVVQQNSLVNSIDSKFEEL